MEFATRLGAQKGIRTERQMTSVFHRERITRPATSLGKIKDTRTEQVTIGAFLPVLQHPVEKLATKNGLLKATLIVRLTAHAPLLLLDIQVAMKDGEQKVTHIELATINASALELHMESVTKIRAPKVIHTGLLMIVVS